MTTPPYSIDPALEAAFPANRNMPSLLSEFAEWLGGHPWGSVGYFDLVRGHIEIAPIVDASPLWGEFALFIRLPEGSVGGFWYGAPGDPASPPVVILGSEGQYLTFAPDLQSFIARLALGGDALHGWTDFEPMPDYPDERPALRQWLAKQTGRNPMELAAQTPASNFADFADQWSIDRENYWADHPRMQQLAEILSAYRPPAEPAWGRTVLTAQCVGDRFAMQVLQQGPQPVPEAGVAEPVLRAIRDEMAEANPGLGLWTQANLFYGANGAILPSFDFMSRPDFDGQPVDHGQFEADLERAPRPAQRIPDWVAS